MPNNILNRIVFDKIHIKKISKREHFPIQVCIMFELKLKILFEHY